MESNRQKAQYTRDVWARRMQRKMGWTSVNALYVHVFLNGMYWGMYNIAERVDGQFGKDHLGGKKDSIDVIKIEEDGGNHLEASEGDMEAWNLMVQTAKKAADDASYYRLQGKTPDGEDDPLKVDWSASANIRGAWLVPTEEMLAMKDLQHENRVPGAIMDGQYRNLQGQVVSNPVPGIYIRNGRKMVTSTQR